AIHPATPMRGLGKPNAAPCHDPRFLSHWISTLTKQLVCSEGFSSRKNFSRVSWKAAHQPTRLAMISQIPYPTCRVRCVLMCGLSQRRLCASPEFDARVATRMRQAAPRGAIMARDDIASVRGRIVKTSGSYAPRDLAMEQIARRLSSRLLYRRTSFRGTQCPRRE